MSEPKYRIQRDESKGLFFAEEYKMVYPDDGTPVGHEQWVLMTDIESSGNIDMVRNKLYNVVMGPRTVISFDKDMNEL